MRIFRSIVLYLNDLSKFPMLFPLNRLWLFFFFYFFFISALLLRKRFDSVRQDPKRYGISGPRYCKCGRCSSIYSTVHAVMVIIIIVVETGELRPESFYTNVDDLSHCFQIYNNNTTHQGLACGGVSGARRIPNARSPHVNRIIHARPPFLFLELIRFNQQCITLSRYCSGVRKINY